MPAKAKRNSKHNHHALNVLRQFRVIYGSVRQHFRRIEERCGVSGSQLWILQEVQRAPGVGVSQLAVKLSIHQSTCSQLVDKLVRRRLLKKSRSSTDQRRVGLTISAQGAKAVSCAPGPAQGVLPEALSELPDATLQSLQRSLARVIANLDVKDPEAARRPLADL